MAANKHRRRKLTKLYQKLDFLTNAQDTYKQKMTSKYYHGAKLTLTNLSVFALQVAPGRPNPIRSRTYERKSDDFRWLPKDR